MESMGSIPDNEWESICKLLSAPQLNINSAHLLEYSSHITQTNYSQSSENANLGTQSFEENTPLWNNDACLSMDFILDPQNDGSLAFMFVQDDASKEETTFSDPPLPVPKKKARLSNPTNKARKLKKMIREETSQSLECDPSEDALSNDSEEISEIMEESESNKSVTLSSNGKKRANRGEATDPQSLYARRRRMRINERLKILQSLVPNGTKVDISTMLEEAIHYVKFMQLQIRLLSSDDHWMYAPLAYNGVDVGAYKRLSHYISYD